MFDKHFVGLNLTGIEDNGTQRPVSRVTLRVDDSKVLTAGDDTGVELAADCPHATQAMVNSILANVRGLQYRMYNADNAALDPAAELGDGGTFGDVYSVISRIADDGSGYAGAAAPGEADLEDEYPSAGPMTQEFNRQIAQTRSSITKTAEMIRLEVANEVAGLRSEFTVSLDSITARVEGTENRIGELKVTADGITTRVEATEEGLEGTINHVSAIEQYAKSITLSVSNGETSSTIRLMAEGVQIASQTIKMTGLVTFAGLSGGTTTINGACIQTGTISADRIDVSNLKVDTLWGASDKVAIYSERDHIYVGGRKTSETFEKLDIYGRTIKLSIWGDSSAGLILSNTSPYCLYSATDGLYNLGKEANRFNSIYGKTLYIKDIGGITTVSGNNILCSSSNNSYIGSNSVPWDAGYFNRMYIKDTFQHKGTGASLGFFNASPQMQKTVTEVSISGTLANAITGINNVIKALKAYGLFK